MNINEKILVIFPHPDDEAFSSAGTIALHTKKRDSVTYICATLGEMGRNMGNPPFANRETLPKIRKKELKNACAVLGIDDLRMLGLRDKTLEFEDLDALADRFLKLIEDVNPSVIITFYPGYAIHPDHDACGEAVVRAVEKLAPTQRPTLYCKAITQDRYDKLGQPGVIHDVSEVADTKIAAIKAHKSQTGLISGMKDKLTNKDPEMMDWLMKEEFYIYRFNV